MSFLAVLFCWAAHPIKQKKNSTHSLFKRKYMGSHESGKEARQPVGFSTYRHA